MWKKIVSMQMKMLDEPAFKVVAYSAVCCGNVGALGLCKFSSQVAANETALALTYTQFYIGNISLG